MKFVFPIENKTAEELYKLNRDGYGGYFPIGLNNCYHGGIHLDGNYPIVSIADGTVIAYRYRRKYMEHKSAGKVCRYSNGFVLIRHEYQSPKGQKLIFNHLRPWEEFTEEQKKRLPAIFTKSGYKVTASSLNVRSSMDSSGDGNIISGKKLVKGNEVVASPVDERWAKKEGVEEYFVYKGNTVPVQIVSEPTFDQIVVVNIPVKAGTLVGYTGLVEVSSSVPEGHTTVHIEVFAKDDAVAFIRNEKKDGDKKPTLLQVSGDATLRACQKKYPNPESLSKATLRADTTVTVLEHDPSCEWTHVQVKELTRSVKREWLEYHEKTARDGEHYTPKKEKLAEISKAFDGLELTVSSKLKLVAKDGETNCRIKYAVSEEKAEKYWVKKSLLGEIKNKTATTAKNITECYRINPEAVMFQNECCKVKEDHLVKLEGIETKRDEGKKLWYHIKASGIDGWISEDDPKLKKLSAFDWPGFKIAKEEGNTAYDPIIDFNNLSQFFKQIVDEINTDSDRSTISKDELKKAMTNESISWKLSRLICFHQSEWWVDSEMKYWEAVFKIIGSERAELQREIFRNFCFWEEVLQKSKNFLPTPNVYCWHPVAFVENMREMNKESPWIVIAKGEIGQKEISGTKHNSRIVEYHKTTSLPESFYNDETAWCSSFVNWVMLQAGYSGTQSAKALSWAKWGKKYDKPAYGSVAVIKYDEDRGHVGFVVGKDLRNRLIILGGNQGKQGEGSVNYKAFEASKIIAYTFPEDYSIIEYDLPIIDEEIEEGTFESTR